VAEVDLAFQPLMPLQPQPKAARALLSKRIAAQIHRLQAAAAQVVHWALQTAALALPTATGEAEADLTQLQMAAMAAMAHSPAAAAVVAQGLQTGSTPALAAMAAAALCVCGAGDDDGIRNP